MIILAEWKAFICFVLQNTITVSNTHNTGFMDYGKSVVIIEDNSIFQPTGCQHTTFFLVALFSHQLFLLICGFPVTKLKATPCLSCVLDNADFPWWLGLSHFLFLKRKRNPVNSSCFRERSLKC